MYRNILQKVNFFIYLAVALLVITIQSTLFAYFPLNYFQPDLILILSIFLGFRRSPLEGGLLVIFMSSLVESHSGSAQNFFLTTNIYAFIITQLLSRTVIVSDMVSVVGICVALSVLKKIGLLFLLGLAGHASNGIRHFFVYLVPGTLVQALLTPLCFSWFRSIDLRTYKDEHADDEYDINKGF